MQYGAQRMALKDYCDSPSFAQHYSVNLNCKKPQSAHKTYIAFSINTGTSLEQLPRHMIMSHLCGNPQRSGTIRTPGVWNGSMWQQEHEYLEVAVLRHDEQRSGAVLSAQTQLCPVELDVFNMTIFCKTWGCQRSGAEDLCLLGCDIASLGKWI
jgi:hypothetical protein